MSYVFLFLSVFLCASSSVFGKFYNRKNACNFNSLSIYNVLLLATVFICWGVLYAIKFSFNVQVLPYSVLFGLFFFATNFGFIYALKYGPASLTSLFITLSLIMTTIWGFLFWNSKITVSVIIGLILVVVSIVLCIIKNGDKEKKTSLKWLFFVLVGMISNAGCNIVQRTQQMKFGGQHGEMLMAFATFLSFAIFLAVYLIKDRKAVKVMQKHSWCFPVLAGVFNFALNVFIIILATSELSASLIYPTIGVGGLVVVILFSLFVFKEKLEWFRWLGILLGIVAIVLLV